MTSRRTNGYTLPEKKNKADYVRKNFNEISGGYDRFNDWITFGFHRFWKKKVALTVREHNQDIKKPLILDLCTGSGDIAFFLIRKIPDARIQAIDFSEGMLRNLYRKIEERQLKKEIQVKNADVSNLKFIKTGSIDGVTMGFGLRNVTSREKTLKEILRVLKPGGIYVNLDVGQVEFKPAAFFHQIYFEKVVPLIGFILHGEKHEMYRYLPASAKTYPGQAELKKELEKAGFTGVKYTNFMFGSAAMHCAVKPFKIKKTR